MARIIGVTPMTDSTRLRARAGTRHISHRKHAPFPLFSSSWHPLFRLSLSYLFLFSCCIFLIFSFLFFFFSCLSSGPLYSSIFFSFRSLNSFQPESSISLRYPHYLYIILIHDLYLPNDFSIDS